MNDPEASTTGGGEAPRRVGRDAALRTRFERLRALRSAWGVLAPSGLSSEKVSIADSGRALSEELVELLSEGPSSGDDAVIADLDARVHELESEMRLVALKIPVAQLRSTLPERVTVDRRGILDLLDLVLGAEIAGQGGIEKRIPTLDYLISLLCTGGDPDAPLQDPVTLTPLLHALCERSDIDYDPKLPELEAEFFAAADMHQADAREEVELRTLRRRKMELGAAFFAPRVLRAIMTYNAALLRRIDEEVLHSQDWGVIPTADAPETGASVFETQVLPKLLSALRRRAAGDPPAHDALDRIAWCLDLSGLTAPERAMLMSEAPEQGLKALTILVGLLLRSAVVLDEEYPAIGIAPAELAGAWVRELEAALQQLVNPLIAAGDYDGACALTDLSKKFLSPAKAESHRRIAEELLAAPTVAAEAVAEESARTQAERIARDAVRSLPKEAANTGWRQWPRARALRAVAVASVAGVGLAVAIPVLFDAERVAGADLAEVSPYLASGRRSAEGTGPAFVGTLDDDWFRLEAAEQKAAAAALTEALRERGVREIMVFDGDRRLTIQALGSQPPRVIRPAPRP